MARNLSQKQQLFVQEYLKTHDVDAAAQASGIDLDKPRDGGGFYVYLLCDPRNREIFYVGKGKGGRAYQHAKQAKMAAGGNHAKSARINAIHHAGHDVDYRYFASGLDEQEAFSQERLLIQVFKEGLSNIQSGVMTREEASKLWAQQRLEQMETLESYLGHVDDHVAGLTTRVFGSPEAAWRYVRSSLERLAAHGDKGSITVREEIPYASA